MKFNLTEWALNHRAIVLSRKATRPTVRWPPSRR
jgi:hypothetical protein